VDVSIRVSLQGGHHWEFVCDEDDPMVFGLVSALPGAKLDASLPPDGLIQVEARNGQRFFLSRSSLVALTISRLPAGQQTGISAAAVDLRATGLYRPTVDGFLQVVARRSGADDHSLQEVEIGGLPTAAPASLGWRTYRRQGVSRARPR